MGWFSVLFAFEHPPKGELIIEGMFRQGAVPFFQGPHFESDRSVGEPIFEFSRARGV